jgi:hypothetical protein
MLYTLIYVLLYLIYIGLPQESSNGGEETIKTGGI